MKLRLKTRTGFMTVVAVYAPTDTEDAREDTNGFYDQLTEMIQMIPTNDLIVILGDFNARVTNSEENDVVGKFCLNKETTQNGNKLIEFCMLNGLLIMNTFFRKKRIHQGTWQHPRTKKWHMIDYVLTNKKYRSSVEDVCVRRGADVDSDHNMVLAKLRMHLKSGRMKDQTSIRKIDRARISDDDVTAEAQEMTRKEIEAKQRNWKTIGTISKT